MFVFFGVWFAGNVDWNVRHSLSAGGRGASSACACGVSPRHAFPAGVSNTRSNQLCDLKEKTAGSSYSEPYFKTSSSFMFFSCNPQWMEEICDTPAE